MQNNLDFIDSLSNDTINKIRNSKSDAEARRILKENNAELLQSRVVGQSEQLTCKNHPYGNTYTSTTGALCCVECFTVIKAS